MELFGNYKSECDYLPTAVVLALKKRKMKKVGDNSWDYYLPCGYTYCEDNVRGFKNEKSGKKIFMIDGCDWIASKVTLWQLIKKKFGNEASSIMPETFVLSNIKDMYKFKKFYQLRKSIHSGSKFIVKNFQQRQEGLKLLNNIDEINTSIKDGFKLVQDYLENPYLISKRKVNLRYYILVICHQGVINAYVYKDGFVYYTPKFFEKYSMDFHKNITTGYIDRRVYEENPLTVDEFRKRLGPEKAKKWDNEVIKKLNMVMVALSEQICSCDKLSKHVRFQIFGADLAPDENLEGTLMEINKGPDIGFKDDKDGKVKKEMVDGAFSIIEGEKDKDHGYSRIF
tara:strand:+ start:784 stop:1803 length:1020 start_codon:yes stop_codon:yes gene_type:complete